jgi:hypothetical protein
MDHKDGVILISLEIIRDYDKTYKPKVFWNLKEEEEGEGGTGRGRGKEEEEEEEEEE